MVKKMDMVLYICQIIHHILEHGKITYLMDKESINGQREEDIKVLGKMENVMAMASNTGMMEKYIVVIIRKIKNTVMEFSLGQEA